MVGVLILTHGCLGEEILDAARTIAGDLDHVEALCLDWSEGLDEAGTRLAAALERLDDGDGVLILTDMHGGTPSNVAMRFYRPGRIQVLTGVNLPMVVRLGCLVTPDRAVDQLAQMIRSKGKASIRLGAEVRSPAAAPRRGVGEPK